MYSRNRIYGQGEQNICTVGIEYIFRGNRIHKGCPRIYVQGVLEYITGCPRTHVQGVLEYLCKVSYNKCTGCSRIYVQGEQNICKGCLRIYTGGTEYTYRVS